MYILVERSVCPVEFNVMICSASRSTSKPEESIKYEDIKARVGRITCIDGATLNYCPIMHLNDNVERSVAISILDLYSM